MKVVKTEASNILVIAGAGSGKTLTIIGKIKYLINRGILEDEILCISFTKMAATSLQKKLEKENIYINVKTFHSLGYNIIKDYYDYKLIDNNLLIEIVEKHLKNNKYLYLICKAPFIEIGKGNINDIKNNIILNTNYKEKITNTIISFINLFKGNNYELNKFKDFYIINKQTNPYYKQKSHKCFLDLVNIIIKDYQHNLKINNKIDFHDMINMASKIVKQNGIYPYKYIIIDEYQDTSLNKCLLIKNIKEKTKAKLIAVGDDWQSIYRFTGSDLQIFTNFNKYFKKTKIIKLKKTYRNSKQLLNLASKFIKKNPNQLSKKLLSDKQNKTPFKIYYYQSSIKEIWPQLVIDIENKETLILGRNNKDINLIPKLNQNMKYMTIHKAKGLEAQNVIIINLENTITGIPSKIKTDEYLKYVTKIKEQYPLEEERRLFYVAITRTKTSNYLIVKKDNPSLFVKEILNYGKKYVEIRM